jgi:hypothetical protein
VVDSSQHSTVKWSSKYASITLMPAVFQEPLVVQKEFYGDLAINNEVNCVCMASVNEISSEWLNSDAIRKATDLDEQLSKSSPMNIP